MIKIDMASTVEQLLNPETPLATGTPADVQQPQAFSAKDSYFVLKSVKSPVWKIGLAAGKPKSTKNMELTLVFCTNEKCKNSRKLPPGHINEFIWNPNKYFTWYMYGIYHTYTMYIT